MALPVERTFTITMDTDHQPQAATGSPERLYVLGRNEADGASAKIYVTDWSGDQKTSEQISVTSTNSGGLVDLPQGIAYQNHVLHVSRWKTRGANPSGKDWQEVEFFPVARNGVVLQGGRATLIPDVEIGSLYLEVIGNGYYFADVNPFQILHYDSFGLFRLNMFMPERQDPYDDFFDFCHRGTDGFYLGIESTTPLGNRIVEVDLAGNFIASHSVPGRVQAIGGYRENLAVVQAVFMGANANQKPVTVYSVPERSEEFRERRLVMVPGEQVSTIFRPRGELGVWSRSVSGSVPPVYVELSPDGQHWDTLEGVLRGSDYGTYKIPYGFACRLRVSRAEDALYYAYIGYVGIDSVDIAGDVLERV